MSADQYRIVHITLDETGVARRNPEIEQEKRIALNDLLQENFFRPLDLPRRTAGPFALALSCREGRLRFGLSDRGGDELGAFTLPLRPFRNLIREYFVICESYFAAVKSGNTGRIEAVDMGRRGIHDQASELLRERLAAKVDMDSNTARRLFTLICVLQIGQRLSQ